MYVQVITTSTSTTATSTRTNCQAPQTAISSAFSLLTAALAGLILVTPIWPVSGLEAEGVTPKYLKDKTNTRIQCPLIAKKRGYSGLL